MIQPEDIYTPEELTELANMLLTRGLQGRVSGWAMTYSSGYDDYKTKSLGIKDGHIGLFETKRYYHLKDFIVTGNEKYYETLFEIPLTDMPLRMFYEGSSFPMRVCATIAQWRVTIGK